MSLRVCTAGNTISSHPVGFSVWCIQFSNDAERLATVLCYSDMASPSKGRKRSRIHHVDSLQKSIKSFCVVKEKPKDTFRPSLKEESCSQSSFCSTSELYRKNLNSTVAVKKKQTLLAPFDGNRTPGCFRIKKMDSSKQKEFTKIVELEEDLDESGIEIIECSRPAELKITRSGGVSGNFQSSDAEPSSDIDNTFGLFGVSSSEDEELESYFDAEMAEYQRMYFKELPDEILENIFCQLPLIDLLLNLSVVCKRWHNIISNDKFLVWKKRYYCYKYCVQRRREIDELLAKEQLKNLPVFPTNFSRFLSKFRVIQKGHSHLHKVLEKHSKYHLIEKFQQTIEKGHQNCWSTVGLLVLVSSSVHDIQEIVACLMSSSAYLLHDIIECLYCMALIFFVLMADQHDRYSSHHYRLYYALYLHENTSHCMHSSLRSAFGANYSGQQSILKYRDTSEITWLTHEQVRIMNHNTKRGDVLKIIAFAGTGKTTTLVEYTKLRPSWTFLNVAYNKTVQEQAVKKFPNNVESRTVHSLAYKAQGFKFRGKLASSIRVNSVMDALNVPKEKKGSFFLHSKRVIDTLTNFIASYDLSISSEHVPYQELALVESEEERQRAKYYNSEEYHKIVVRDCKVVWEKMSDPKNLDIRITHDGYLKLYQLSKPVITDYDCILIDEAQDCTPAVADILLNQTLAKILVGDPHQQIYGFRGATNAMTQVTATHTYYLTQSFRFGPEIASVAASLLNILKGVRSKTIVGVARQGGFLGDQVGQLAVICRTNFTLFNNLVQTCRINNKARIGLAGGIQGYNLDRVLDIYRLFTGQAAQIEDKFIKNFKTLNELKTYAQKAPDLELLGKIKIVESHNIHVESHIQRIKKQYCPDSDQADIVFSTAHKSKGLEFDTVRLAEDFLSDIPLKDLRNVLDDEKNLLYVAVTRAKHRLQLPCLLFNLLTEKTDLLLHCKPISALEDLVGTFCACVKCKCQCDFSTSYLTVRCHSVTLGSTQIRDGGCLCSTCALKHLPVLGNMLTDKER